MKNGIGDNLKCMFSGCPQRVDFSSFLAVEAVDDYKKYLFSFFVEMIQFPNQISLLYVKRIC